jgi:TldD protein
LAGCGGAAAEPPLVKPAAKPPASPVVENEDFFGKFAVDESMVRKVLAQALSKGGDFADLFFQHRTTNYLGLRDGEVDTAYTAVDLGCGVRVLKDGNTGFAFTEDLDLGALTAAARTAAIVADGPPTPVPVSIRRADSPSYYRIEVPWERVGIERKIPLLEEANKKAMAFDKRIVKVRAFMSDSTAHVLVASSDGLIAKDCQPMTTATVSCEAETQGRREENEHSYGKRSGLEFYTKERIGALAEEAARRTVVLFDAAEPPSGESPVVLAPGLSGILLQESVGHCMEADFNRKGISVFADRIGKPIAPKFITIVDDGTNPHEQGTINIDDEGFDSKRTVLVENGVLRSYIHDRISASQYKVETTSNGRRDCYRFWPLPRMRNTCMLNGPHDPEEIVKSVKKGLYAETFTNGRVRIGSGEFSFYLKNGFLIENGKITRPVTGGNLIGFGPKVLEQVQMVGNDMVFNCGAFMCGKDGQMVPVGCGIPTVKCGGISVRSAG